MILFELFLFLYFGRQFAALNSTTQRVKFRDQSVLTLGSLCIPCHIQDYKQYREKLKHIFYGKKQGERKYGSSDNPCNTRGATGALHAFKVEIDALFKGTQVISTWKHCRR